METPLLVEIQNPNFISNLRALWTLAALVLGAVAAALISTRSGTTLLPRIRSSGKSVIPHPSSYSYSSDDDDDSCSNSDDHSDDEDDDDSEETTPPPPPPPPPPPSLSSSGCEEEFLGQYGNFDSAVKFWDEASFRPGPPSSILTAEAEAEEEKEGSGSRHLAVVRLWDARSAEVAATWRTEGAVAVAGDGTREERVYVVDGIGRLTVVDLRNVSSALGEFHRWSDAVVSAGEEAWRRNTAAAAMCLTFFPETG